MANTKNSAFMEAYKPYHKQLNMYCIALTNTIDDAQDLMGNTIEIAYRKFDTIKDLSKFKFFLFGIASRLSNNERRKWSKKLFVSDTILDAKPSLHNDSETLADYHFLYKALQNLRQSTREALILFELEGFSIKEIAEIQKTNENTIKTRISRGREQLKSILNPHNNFLGSLAK